MIRSWRKFINSWKAILSPSRAAIFPAILCDLLIICYYKYLNDKVFDNIGKIQSPFRKNGNYVNEKPIERL